MAAVIKQYRTYQCTHCFKKSKTERVTEGYTFGTPFYSCPHCGALNYDPYITEPALLSRKKLLKNSNDQWNTILLFLYMPFGLFAFFSISLLLESFLWSLLIVGPVVAFLTIIILIKKRKSNLSEYQTAINQSMQRLNSSSDYAQAVIKLQGVDPDSMYAVYCLRYSSTR